MARKHRICNACGKQIKRGEHWRMVEADGLIAWLLHRIYITEHPQHWNCLHPTQPSPHTFVGVESSLPDHMEKEFENV
jgi:hypothetical protein